MTGTFTSLLQIDAPWTASEGEILVGKDVLELLSTSMYVDPMTIYREYIQNAADAIDEARHRGSLAPGSPGTVAINIDPAGRSVRIRDNGTGIRWGAFVRRLTSLRADPSLSPAARGC